MSTDPIDKEKEEEARKLALKNSTYKGFRVLGDKLLVRIIEQPQAIGMIILPEENSTRPPVVKVLAKGPGKTTRTEYKDHWFPGSKRWGKAGHEIPISGHGLDTVDIPVGEFCITTHQYLKSDPITIDGEDCHIISSYEIAGIVEFDSVEMGFSERDRERMLSLIDIGRVSV